VSARVVIAADGRYSRVARALGLAACPAHPRRWAIGAYFENVAALSSFGEMHVRRHWYIGVAPLPGGLANAVVVTADRMALRRGIALLTDALAADRLLAPRFADGRMLTRPVMLGPLAVDCRVAGAPGLLLAGDAAGFIDPMTGDGLRFALRGGELAAREALAALEHGIAGAHARLYRARRREFGPKFRFNRAIRALVASPAAIQGASVGATLVPALIRGAISYAGDVGLSDTAAIV
jgi:flavin-dependent dehydrogenase